LQQEEENIVAGAQKEIEQVIFKAEKNS